MLKPKSKALEHKILPMKLQFFGGADGGEEGNEEGNNESTFEKIELTQEELNAKLQSEADKRVTEALKTAKEKWEKEFNDKLEKEKKEAERLAKLSEKERKEEELSKREQEIANRLAELERKELKADAVADLNNKGLPAKFADFLLAENAEKTLENINSFKKVFDEAIEKVVNERLRGEVPKVGGQTLTTTNTDDFMEMLNNSRIIGK